MKKSPRQGARMKLSPEGKRLKEKLESGELGTVADAALLLGVSPSWVYENWPRLPGARKVGEKLLRFDLRELRNGHKWGAA